MSDTVTWYRATAHTWSEVPIKPVEVFREWERVRVIREPRRFRTFIYVFGRRVRR